MMSSSIAFVSSLEGFSQCLKPAHVPQLIGAVYSFSWLACRIPAIYEHPEQRRQTQSDHQCCERGPAEDRELLRALQSGAPHDCIKAVVPEEKPPEGEQDGGDRQDQRDGPVSHEEHALQLIAGGYQLKQAHDGYEYKYAVLPGVYNFQGDP
jgi:hypothetical protein